MKASCHLCGASDITPLPEYSGLRRVTSDCKPWRPGGRLGICDHCASIQIIVDDEWRGEINEIYRNYTIYYQGAGAEQSVFDQAEGAAMARSDRLIACVKQDMKLSSHGRLLDFGCGNGGFLRSFNRFFPEWTLAGIEYDDKYRAVVESIPMVEKLFTGGIDQLPGKFDVISLIHVLEHIESPRVFLEGVRAKLNEGGILLIELPYYVENPFELLIADHATHFSAQTIKTLIESAGMQAGVVRTDWVPKELSVIAGNHSFPDGKIASPVNPAVSSLLKWLESVVADAKSLAASSPRFGLFGTSIAGTWLFGELEDKVAFFVDEDANRTGRTHFGLPIYSPADVPEGSDVYVGLPPKISANIVSRLGSGKVSYHEVPGLE